MTDIVEQHPDGDAGVGHLDDCYLTRDAAPAGRASDELKLPADT
jgi:hypothetical protein